MFDLLSTRELTALQSMLFEATEDAYRAANLLCGEADRLGRYRAAHREIAELFIEAATELLERLDSHVLAA